MENIGLVLEGGGMRGVYTAGVLEYFMQEDLYFPYTIGVSAGACMAASYLSRQPGRNRSVNIDFSADKRYISFRNFIKQREIFGMDFIFNEIPNKLVPFDMETFKNSSEQLVVGTTDCNTGEAVYFEKEKHSDDLLKILRASSSLPFIAPSVHYNGRFLLDGGISDPIPIKKAQLDGYQKNIVVLTKSAGYVKKPSKWSSIFPYKKHPKIDEMLRNRYKRYNETTEFIKTEEEKGNVLVIQPSISLPVGRVETNKTRLQELYELGWNDGKQQMKKISQFL